MIKYDSKTKECIIKGNEDDILDEFGVIVYGLRKATWYEIIKGDNTNECK